jgi:23S rRNA (pseudouridine1915-N3)-methyltransferase
MALHVVAVGRVRDAALRAACAEYLTRLKRQGGVTVHEVAEAGRAGTTPPVARRIEAERLRAACPERAYLVALTRTGRARTSEQFAEQVGRWRESPRDVALLIGGAWGLADSLTADADATLSLSTVTLPHELARLVLFEQLYRAGTILRGEPYHKGRMR